MSKRILITSDIHYGFPVSHKSSNRKIITKFFQGIAEVNPDIVVLAGDIASTNHRHLNSCLRLLRSHYKGPVVGVLGNHDFWSFKSVMYAYASAERIFNRHEVVPLWKSTFEMDGLFVVGWNGWYGSFPRHTNDWKWIGTVPFETHAALSSIAYTQYKEAVERVATYGGSSPILAVTHFPCHPGISTWPTEDHNGVMYQLEHISGYIDVLAFGHSHRRFRDLIMDVEVVNAGSDYNLPRYEIVEV